MKTKTASYVAGMLLLVAFSGFAFVQFNDALTPYVSYEQAIASTRTVQVAGGLLNGSSNYDERAGNLHFTLVDTEDAEKTLAVRYLGVKPANFEDAVSIVAIGNWDADNKEFAAHDLLVKCPSKYQGLDDYETQSYSSADGSAATGYDAKSFEDKIHDSATAASGYGESSYAAGESAAGD